jgi:adenine-specific DNA-methyltransferase
MEKVNKQKTLGQYFTTNEELLQKVFDFTKHNEGTILEPSFGQGNMIKFFRDKNVTRDVIAIEIDDSIAPLEGIQENTTIIYNDFLSYTTNIRFTTIVGNPPYFKLKKNPNTDTILKCVNAYVAFIEKAYNLLTENGELVFIIPSDFFKLTSAKKLKELMINTGSFTDIYHPHKENLFHKAAQDIIVFRYQKGIQVSNTKYNDVEMNVSIQEGNVYFKSLHANIKQDKEIKLSEVFDVKVGMVSGAESIFNNALLGNVNILTASGYKTEILIDKLDDSVSNELNTYLQHNKKSLIDRRIKKFNDSNWFQWGCLRNVKFMTEQKDKLCLYAKVLTRDNVVFNVGNVQLYDGSLLCMFPKQLFTLEQLEKIKNFLNSPEFLQHFLYCGRYKVGQKTLSDCFIPEYILLSADYKSIQQI